MAILMFRLGKRLHLTHHKFLPVKFSHRTIQVFSNM